MATVPVDGTHGTQRAVSEINDEMRSLKQQVSSINIEPLQKDIESLQKSVSHLEHLRRIPERGYRTGPSLIRLFLNEDLFWDSPTSVLAVSEVSSSGAVSGDMQVILVDATAGNVSLGLPASSISTGRILIVKKVDSSSNLVTLDPDGAELIDGDSDLSLVSQNNVVFVICDGTGWNILSAYEGY